jgi:hypothetical protein
MAIRRSQAHQLREHQMSGDKHNNDEQVRRIVLPSGRTVDVVYFDNGKDVSGINEQKGDLHICPKCASLLVYPTEWTDVSSSHWEVSLRCPECEWRHVGVFDQATLDRFDEVLDWGTDDLIDDLEVLVQANMEGDVERFVSALNADAIWPMDFGGPLH